MAPIVEPGNQTKRSIQLKTFFFQGGPIQVTLEIIVVDYAAPVAACGLSSSVDKLFLFVCGVEDDA